MIPATLLRSGSAPSRICRFRGCERPPGGRSSQPRFLLERLAGQQLQWIWPLVERWEKPADTVAGKADLAEIARWVDRDGKAERLMEIARRLADTPEVLDSDQTIHKALRGADALRT